MLRQTAALTSSVYRPEPTIQSQSGTSFTYCNLSTACVWPGRGNLVSAKPLPVALPAALTSDWITSPPRPSGTLPSLFCPSHSGLGGNITFTPWRV
jgi:hypothetical protein